MHPFVVVADDFTGANDTGVQIRKFGESVQVMLRPESIQDDAANLVIDTETRVVAAQTAYEIVYRTIKMILERGGCRFLYKKVDSTLRGHLQEEIQAAIDAYEPELILFAPSYPIQGRTVKDGRLYVHSIPLLETEIATDPRNPLKTDNVKKILASCVKNVRHISVEAVEKDDFVLSASAYTFDASTEQHLYSIAQAGLKEHRRILWIGSAGLAKGLLRALHPMLPSLAIVGSVSSKTMDQIQFCKSQGINILALPMQELYETHNVILIAEQAIKTLQSKKDVLITGAQNRKEYEQFKTFGDHKGISPDSLAEFTKRTLSSIVPYILKRTSISGLFLTGGDTAIATIEALGAQGSQIEREILPGFVQGTLIGGDFAGTSIITKAGAFGTEKDIFDCLMKIKE